MLKISSTIKYFSKKTPSLVSLNLLNYYGDKRNHKNLLRQSDFLKNELLIRLSQRVVDLINLPYGLPKITPIRDVINLYSNSFKKIHEFPDIIDNKKIIQAFTKLVSVIKKDHSNIDQSIALGLKQLHPSIIDYPLLNNELDKFFLSRISIRLLISHQESIVFNNENFIQNINIVKVFNDCISNMNSLCFQLYNEEPNILFDIKDPLKNINIKYVPSYIYYPIIEILKNSIVAHAKHNKLSEPIRITVSETDNSIYIKISDLGNGFHFDYIPRVLSYSYTTSDLDYIDNFKQMQNLPIISGFGFGLPLAKIYCQYFGGDLIINPMENLGTDVFIYLDKLGDKKELIF